MKLRSGRFLAAALSLLLLTAALTGCVKKVQAADMMKGISAEAVSGKNVDAKFTGRTADFSLELFRNSIKPAENSLISPLSVLLALAMTANGADTETLAQMETVLGKDIPLAELNEYLYSYVRNLPREKKAKLSIANSIWFRGDEGRLTVEQGFLQTNANYYGAAAYRAAFDQQTVEDINTWVKANTDGMIDKILDKIDDDTVMYLINAMAFDAEWERVYNKEDIRQGEFTCGDGSKQAAEFMNSEELQYIDTPQATGFIKHYAGGKYSFVALLPREEVSIQDYISSLSGEDFLQAMAGAEDTAVSASLPKFSYDYTVQMNDCLKVMGMPTAFSPTQADFTQLGKSPQGNIYIGEVVHKTFIAVDERGTKAGAVTSVEMKTESYRETKVVTLDRPFVYAIIDTDSGLPIFIGTVMDLE